MKITACPRCGSKHIFQGTILDGVLTGYTSKDVCRECGYQGSPIIFESEDEYNKFNEELKAEKEPEKKIESELERPSDENREDELGPLSKKDKEVTDFLNELAEEIPETKETTNENEKKTNSNPLTTLGIVLVIVGILITAATYGAWIFYTGPLLLVGLILVVIGYVTPAESRSQDKENIKPTIAGICLMLGGIVGLLLWVCLFFFDITLFYNLSSQQAIWQLQNWMRTCASIGIILSFFTLLGGIIALKRKFFVLSLLCSILGLFTLSGSIFSLIGLIFIAMSRNEFK